MAGNRHFLVVDAYDRAGRSALTDAGATAAGRLYATRVSAVDPSAQCDVLEISDATTVLPAGVELQQYDGIVWTGSNLTIHKPGPLVRRQVELARTALAARVPQFGSCWAVHLATVAAGGECGANPRGREFGVAKGLTLTASGREHPLLRGRGDSFAAFTSHEDMVTSLPADVLHLVRNDFAEVQGVSVGSGRGSFWAVQYHPEYDFHEIACLGWLRRDQLVREGRFADEEAVRDFAARCEELHSVANAALSAGERDVADPGRRLLELRNWMDEVARLGR